MVAVTKFIAKNNKNWSNPCNVTSGGLNTFSVKTKEESAVGQCCSAHLDLLNCYEQDAFMS